MILIMGVRFICEVIALVIFGFWGFHQWKSIGAIAVPLVVMVIWGMFCSPKAPYKLQSYYGFIVEFSIFSLASYFLYRLGHPYLAILSFIVTLGISSLLHLKIIFV